MGQDTSCACAPENCKKVGCDGELVEPRSRFYETLGFNQKQTEDLDVTTLPVEEVIVRLRQLASAEETQHHVAYAAILQRVLELLTAGLANVPGSAALVAVLPSREADTLELEYSDGGQLTSELANVTVHDKQFETSLSSCAWCYDGELDQRGRPMESGFAVDFTSGQVLAASASFLADGSGLFPGNDYMTAVDIASNISRGVVLTRSKQGVVSVYPAAEVQWSRALQVAAPPSKGGSRRGDNVELAVMLDNLGTGHLQKGNPQAAKQLHERALRIQEAHYGRNHVQVAVTLDNLGIAYTELGNPEQAKELLERALAIHETHFGRDHVQVAWTLDNLGSALRDLGELRRAQTMHERALQIYTGEYGSDHRRLGRTLNALGHTHRGLGNPSAAKPFYQRALAVYENEVEPDAAQVAVCYNNLGNAVREMGDVQAARSLYVRALATAEAHFGPTHTEVGRTLNNLGLAHLELGNASSAQPIFVRALEIFEARFGPRSSYSSMARTNLATCLAVLGKNKEAKDCVFEAEASADAQANTICLELELRAAAVRFAVGDVARPTPQDRWNKAEGQLHDLLGAAGLDAVCARCKEGLQRTWQHCNRPDVMQWLQARGTARI